MAGGSPVTAPLLTGGEPTRVEVSTGQPAWLAVRLAESDVLTVAAQIADGAPVAGALAELRVVGPAGGLVDVRDPTLADQLPGPGRLTLLGGSSVLSTTVGPVAEQSEPIGEGGDYQRLVPGVYYVLVFVQRLSGSAVSSVPVTVNALTRPRATFPGDSYVAPTYTGEFTDPIEPGGAEPSAYRAPELSDRAQASGRSLVDWLLIAGLLALSVAAAAVGVVILRRPGTTGPDPSPPVQGGR